MSKHETIVDLLPHYRALINYCNKLTGNLWDGEDLLQETVIKTLRYMELNPHSEITKSFLFKVANHAWIDHVRKRKGSVPLESGHEQSFETVQIEEVYDAMERLVRTLPLKQACILLLIDVFQFTAREASEILGDMKEGAVKRPLDGLEQSLHTIPRCRNPRRMKNDPRC